MQDFLILGFITLFALIIFLRKRRLFQHKLLQFAGYSYRFIYPSQQTLQGELRQAQIELRRTAIGYAKSGIEHIVLIHGTFAGDDPLLLNKALAHRTPRLFRPLHFLYGKSSKKIFDLVGRDLGNFTDGHKRLLEENFKQNISLFNWSGSNSHYGRLQGALELIEFLYHKSNNSTLIMAHSHGGQLLALMTQLFKDESIRDALLKEKLISEESLTHIKRIKNFKYRLVTMGTPVRYKWMPDGNSKILHFINHRGRLPLGGSLIGGFWNSKGDYIQQFGGAGSDNLFLLDIYKHINKKLEFIFKEDNPGFLSLHKRRQRLHHQGLNLLVDYQDAKRYPNFHKTLFGHGIYTRYHLLPFHLQQILKYTQ